MRHFSGMTVFFCFLVLCCAIMQVRASFEVEADSLSWSPVGTGVIYARADSTVGNIVFVGIGGYTATQDLIQSWVTELYSAKLRAMGVQHIYSVRGPGTMGYVTHDIGTLDLARHLLTLMQSTPGITGIIVAAHSSGAYVAHALFRDLYDATVGIDSTHRTDGKVIYFLLDEAIGTVSGAFELNDSWATRLRHIYGVYSYNGAGLYSYAPQQMIALGNRYGSRSSPLMLDGSGSGCISLLCLHMSMINQVPHDHNSGGLLDFTDFTPQHPVQTHYLDVLPWPRQLMMNRTSVDFGPVLKSMRDTAIISIGNLGFTPVTLKSIANSHLAFTLPGLPSLPLVIPPDSSMQFKVALYVDEQGAVNDTVTITSDDPLQQIARISLHAKGIASVAVAEKDMLYATTPGSSSEQLLSVDSAASAHTIGPLGVFDVKNLTIRSTDGILYGLSTANGRANVYQISGVTGEAGVVGHFPISDLSALAFSPGDTLYGVNTQGTLYRLDISAGRADSLGTKRGLQYSGLAFHPKTGELWASMRYPTDRIVKLNMSNGDTALVGLTGFSSVTVSIAFDVAGRLYALIDAGGGQDYLTGINTINAAWEGFQAPLAVSNLHTMTFTGTWTGPTTTVETTAKGLPEKMELFQNYPNPFNPSTVIKYTVGGAGSQRPGTSKIRLAVYDLLGREVAVLVNVRKPPGSYEATFDASGLSSGVYLCRMQAGGFVDTKKLVLVK